MLIMDWSSDVCSSDLKQARANSQNATKQTTHPPQRSTNFVAVGNRSLGQLHDPADRSHRGGAIAPLSFPALLWGGLVQLLAQAAEREHLQDRLDEIGRAAGRERVGKYG